MFLRIIAALYNAPTTGLLYYYISLEASSSIVRLQFLEHPLDGDTNLEKLLFEGGFIFI